MDAFLNTYLKIQAYGDRSVNSNPQLRFVDWSRNNTGIVTGDPKSEGHQIAPGASQLIFDGTRVIGIDSTTTFNLTLSPLDPSRYRFTWTGVGANPSFRVDRNLTLNTRTLTWAVQANGSVLVTLNAGTFGSTVVGDTVFVPNTTTGDAASPVSVLNSGFWTVLGVISSTQIQLARSDGQNFEGTSEVVTLTSDAQFQAFSTAGVQRSDSLSISAGFALSVRKTFDIVAVTPKFLEVISTSPLPNQTGITPGAAGFIIFTAAKSVLYVEADQECILQLNGDTGSFQRLSPIEHGNPDKPGIYLKRGPTWSLTVVNSSSVIMNILVIHAE